MRPLFYLKGEKKMARSAIYVANTGSQEINENGNINLGTILRRFGCNFGLAGTGLSIAGPGYYEIEASITLAPAAEGEITVAMYKDEVAVPGASATVTAAAAGDSVNLSILSLVRECCPCADTISNLTFKVLGGTATVTNIAIVGEKL